VAGDESIKSLLRICIALLCGGAVVLILVILNGKPLDDTSGKVLATAVALAFLTLTSASGNQLIERQPGISVVGYLTIGASLLALVIVADLIWQDSFASSSGLAHWAWYTLIAAFALGNTSALLTGYDDTDPDSVKLVRLGTAVALWALVVTVIAEIRTPGHDVDSQQMGITAVIYGLGTLVLPLLRRVAD